MFLLVLVREAAIVFCNSELVMVFDYSVQSEQKSFIELAV
jgi:hypothetical protein